VPAFGAAGHPTEGRAAALVRQALMDTLEAIKRLYYGTTRATIERDLARAVDLLKSMTSDEERQRAAV
jgi:hypothetical protein